MGAARKDVAPGDADEFRLERVRLDGIKIVAVHGDCDLLSAGSLRDALTSELESDDGAALIVDLTRATVFDSTCLGMLVLALKAARASGRRMAVVASTPVVRLPFEVAGLNRLLPLFATRGEAIQSLSEPPSIVR